MPKPAHKVRGVLLTILFWVLLLPLAAIVAVAKSPKLNTPVKLFLIALITGATFLLCSPKQGSPDSGAAGAGASAASPPSSVASASSSFPAQSALPAKALFLRNNFQ